MHTPSLKFLLRLVKSALIILIDCSLVIAQPTSTNELLKGGAALGDWTTDAPGIRRQVTINDLPRPYATPSANRQPQLISQPEGAWPLTARTQDGSGRVWRVRQTGAQSLH